jgi:uncharacterized protein YaaN involved in tellurite resistance
VTTDELEKSFKQLDLTAKQADELTDSFQATRKKIDSIYVEGQKIDDQLDGIIGDLTDALRG